MSEPFVDRQFVSRTLCVLALTVAFVAVAAAAVIGYRVLLLVFASVLFAVFLRGCGYWLRRAIKVPHPWDVFLVVALLLLAFGLLMASFATHIVAQFEELSRQLEQTTTTIEQQLSDSTVINSVVGEVPRDIGSVLSPDSTGSSPIVRWVATTFGGLLSVLIIVVAGTYLAADGRRYRHGLLALVPPANRDGAQTLLEDIGDSLWGWLKARLVSMAVIGIATSIILLVLDIPMPFTLGAVAALLTFIPNIGAVLAVAVPAVFAIQQGTGTAVAVVSAYFVLQMLESYWLTPLVEQKITTLPAVLVLLVQILAGVLFGVLGVVLASPITLTLFVLVKRLYVDRISNQEPG